MPTRPKRPCSHPKCPALVSEGRFCPQHTTEHNRSVKRSRTDKEENKFYASVEWKRLRKYKLTLNPLCERCEREGGIVLATIVHHKAPLKSGGDWLPTVDELESLCLSCHSREHAPPNRALKLYTYSGA